MKTNTLSLIMTLLLLSSACGNRAKENNKAVDPEENKTTETPLTEISPVETPVVENTRFPDDAEITFRSDKSGSYGDPLCWFDDMLICIDESEYREVFNMYKNRVDTTNKIQAVNGVFSVPLKDGATETGFDYLFGLWFVGILIDEACWFHNTSLYLKTYRNKENEPEGDIIEYQYFKVDLSKLEERKDYNLKVDESWYGEYEFATNASEEDDWHESGAYSVVIRPDSCIFSAAGYQLYFEELCTIEEKGADVINLYFYKLLEGSSRHDKEPFLGTLFRKDGKYYINSPALNSESVYNVDIEIKKTK